jgi:transposase
MTNEQSGREYPEAWGVLVDGCYARICAEETEAESRAKDYDFQYQEHGYEVDTAVVRLIPQPEVDRLIAAAVAAERERCRLRADKMCDLLAYENITDRVYQMIHDQYDAIESGHEPGDGGE